MWKFGPRTSTRLLFMLHFLLPCLPETGGNTEIINCVNWFKIKQNANIKQKVLPET